MPRLTTDSAGPPSHATGRTSGRARWLAGLAAYLAVLGLWLSYAAYGFNAWDECVLAYGGARVLQGQMVWVDFFGYAPGRYLYAALCFRLFGESLWSLRLGFCALTAGMPLLAYCISRRMMPARWALLPAAMVALGPSVYYFRSFPFVALLGGWSLCRLLEAPGVRRQLLHGLLLFVCTMLEGAGGIFVLLLTPAALWFSEGPWMARPTAVLAGLARIFGAALFAATPVLGFYAWHGRLWEALSLQAYRYVVTGASMWVAYPRPWESLAAGDWQAAAQGSFFWMMGGLLAGAALLGCIGAARGKRLAPEGASYAAERQLLLLCLLGCLNFLLPLYRAGFFNVLRAAPLPWILGSFLMHRLCSAGAARWIGRGLLIYPAVLGAHLLSDPQYRNLSTGGLPGGALREDLVRLEDSRGGIWVEPRHAELLRDVLGWIRRDTGARDGIVAVPLSPLFYWFGRRENPTAHDFILPGYWRDAEQIEATLRVLERRPPKLFLYSDVAVDGRVERRFEVYSAPLYEYFLRRYARTDRHLYPLGPGNTVSFWSFRALRAGAHWPLGLEEPSRELAPVARRGPVLAGPLLAAGTSVHGWRLLPGAELELEARGPGRQALLLRARAAGGAAAWARPVLRLGSGAQSLVLATEALEETELPPMSAVLLEAAPGEIVRLRLELQAERPEQLGGEVQLLQLCLLPESEVFYRPDEEIRGTEWP